MNSKRNRGAAILAAILVVAIAATAAAGLLYSQSLWLQESTLSADAAQSRMAARAGIAWAAAVLRQDALTSPIDHLHEPWATPLPATEVEGARIEGVIRDLQGRYNLNNLVRAGISQPQELARYKRLLSALELPPALAQTLADWMDVDAEPNGEDGAEDAHYLALANAYRTSGQPLAELNELLRVKGYTHNVVFALRPYVSALPSPSAINVNTAPAETLMLVADRLSLADARLLAAARERSYFRDLADFRARLPPSAYPLHADGVRTTSEFFSVDAQVKRGAAFVHAQAIIQRGAQAWPSVLWQRYD
jgi:general secretion pathway protein K